MNQYLKEVSALPVFTAALSSLCSSLGQLLLIPQVPDQQGEHSPLGQWEEHCFFCFKNGLHELTEMNSKCFFENDFQTSFHRWC